jgi:hypothetical protein
MCCYIDKLCGFLCTKYKNEVVDHKNAIEIRRDIASCLCFGFRNEIDIIKKSAIAKATTGSLPSYMKCLMFDPIAYLYYLCFKGFPSSAVFEERGTITDTVFLAGNEEVQALRNYVFQIMGMGPGNEAM